LSPCSFAPLRPHHQITPAQEADGQQDWDGYEFRRCEDEIGALYVGPFVLGVRENITRGPEVMILAVGDCVGDWVGDAEERDNIEDHKEDMESRTRRGRYASGWKCRVGEMRGCRCLGVAC
jgi:hypothetical protein